MYLADTSPRAYQPTRVPVHTAHAAAGLAHPLLPDHEREHVLVMTLDRLGGLIAVHVLTSGTPSHALMDPRQILRRALLDDAHAIILFHNHPSGSPVPSPEDIDTTRNLSKATQVVGLTLLDHVILTADAGVWTSLQERGVM